MKIFLSWSGQKSQQIANELSKWIPTVLQSTKPYFSPSDIEKGSKWDSEITKNLNECGIGIICVTPENTTSPWILFEAGALSNKLEKSKVCPLLFELINSDLTGPLSTFQTTVFNKEEFKKLILTLNKQLGDTRISESILEETFEMFFPKLETKITEILKQNISINSHVERSEREILEEILELTRIQHNNAITAKKSNRTPDKDFIFTKIFEYMRNNNFRLKEYKEIDEDILMKYLEADINVRKAAISKVNLKEIISEFMN